MLFKKDHTPSCSYCKNVRIMGDDSFICPKKGVVERSFSCFAYSYDPLKRRPHKQAIPNFSKLNEEDFKL